MRHRFTLVASVAVSGLAVATALANAPSPLADGGRRICHAPPSDAVAGYGTVAFANTCSGASQPALEREIAKLHSFEADSDTFAGIAKRDPSCGIAFWGAAMSARGNPLGGALGAESITKGLAFVARAAAVKTLSPRERGLVDAMATYYRDYPNQIDRARAYADVMDRLHATYPDDADIAALDGLAIIEGVDLNDKTYARQKRAGAILEAVMAAHPDHPGAPHYLIHAFDYTALAKQAVHAATVYPTIATASSHAQHMPSHIWSMLGEWDKSIDANRKASFLADPSSGHGPVKGDIVFEHAFDFIAYARLQEGEDRHVAQDLAGLEGGDVPLIVEARYPLERGDWAAAAKVPVPVPKNDAFDAALARFTRAYGAARAGDADQADTELRALEALRAPVKAAAGTYWAEFVDIYAKAAKAWILAARGQGDQALASMREAADQDDGHEKHIYLENKILPMRESLGDMEARLGHPREALAAYEGSLKLAPNRYRSFLGAARAATAVGDNAGARGWWLKLVELSKEGDNKRPGLAEAKAALASRG